MRFALLLSAAGLALPAAAQGPTFDCKKAAGTVEQQICSDASLTALDRQLDTVYQAATAKAGKTLLKTLRAEQRGWVKGRNDCWKANGIGRIGSVVGSMGGGAMLAMGLTLPALFAVVGIPAIVAGLTLAMLGVHRTRTQRRVPDAVRA
eukprot:gene178-biopygen128